MAKTRWNLMRGNACLGMLILRQIDQPFFYCDFAPRPEFEPYWRLFNAEAASLKSDREDHDKLSAKVGALDLTLVDVECGETISGALLHIDQTGAWFRY